MIATEAELRTLLQGLIDAQLDGTRLAKRVMLLQELADTAQSVARVAYDKALEANGDPEAIEWAVATGSAANHANAEELAATIAWREHLEHADRLVDAARSVLGGL
jgi:hypothetical protein